MASFNEKVFAGGVLIFMVFIMVMLTLDIFMDYAVKMKAIEAAKEIGSPLEIILNKE